MKIRRIPLTIATALAGACPLCLVDEAGWRAGHMGGCPPCKGVYL